MSYNRKELQVQSSAKKKQNPFLKDMIYDPKGQWAHPGQPTRIPSNQITMAGVPYPVLGIDNFGNQQMMYPGGEYSFPGDYVDEFPMAQVSASVPDYAAQAFFSDTQKRRQREEDLKSLGPTVAKAKAEDELRREEARLKSKRREESSVLNTRSIPNDPAEVILAPFLENLSSGINTNAGYDKKWSSFAKRAFDLDTAQDYSTEVDEFGRPTPGAIEQSLFNMYLTRRPNNIFEPYSGDPTAVQIKDYERYLPDTLTIPKKAMPIIQDALYTGMNNEMSKKLQEQFPDVPEHVIEDWIGQLHGLRDYGFGRNYTTVDTIGDIINVERKDDFGFWQDDANSNESWLQKNFINTLESTVKSTGAGPFDYRQKWQYKIDPKTKYGILQRQYGGGIPKAQVSNNIPASEYLRIYGFGKNYDVGTKTVPEGGDLNIDPETGKGYFLPGTGNYQEPIVSDHPWNLSRFVFDPIVRGKGQTVDANIYDPTTGQIIGRQPFRNDIDSYSQRKIMRKGMPLAKEDLYKYYTQDLNLSKKEARPLVREKMGQLRDMKRFKNIVGPKSQESFKSSNVKSLFDKYRKSSTEQKYSPLDNSRIFAKTGERMPTLSDKKMQKGYSKYLQIWDDKSKKEARQISKDLLNKSKLEDQQQLDEWANMFGVSTKDFIKNNKFYRRGKDEKYSDWAERTGLKMQYGGDLPMAQVSSNVEYPEIYRKRFLGKGESYITKTPFGKHVEKWKYNPLTKTYVAKEIDIAYKDENNPRIVYRKKEIANKNNAYAIHKKRTGMNPWEKWIEKFQVSGDVEPLVVKAPEDTQYVYNPGSNKFFLQGMFLDKLKTLQKEYKKLRKNEGYDTYLNYENAAGDSSVENLQEKTNRLKSAIDATKINYKKGKAALKYLRKANPEKFKDTKVADLYKDPETLETLRGLYKTGELEESRYNEFYKTFGKHIDANVVKGQGANAAYDAERAEQIFNPGGISTAEVAKNFALGGLGVASLPLFAAAAPVIPEALANPLINYPLTGYGVYDATTRTLPEAYRQMSQGTREGYRKGAENLAWAALDLSPLAVGDAIKSVGKLKNFNKINNVPNVKPALDEIEELRRIAQSPEKTISKYDPTNWGSWKERPIEKFEVEATLRNNRDQLKDYFPDDDFPLTENLPLSQVDRIYMTDHEIGTFKNLKESLKQHEPGTPMHDAISHAIKNYKKNIFKYKTSGKPLTGSDAFGNINVNSLIPAVGLAGATGLAMYNQYQDEGEFSPEMAGLGLLGLPLLGNIKSLKNLSKSMSTPAELKASNKLGVRSKLEGSGEDVYKASDVDIEDVADMFSSKIDWSNPNKKAHEMISDAISDVQANKVEKWSTPEGKKRLQDMIDDTPWLKEAGITPENYVESIAGLDNDNLLYLNKLQELEKNISKQNQFDNLVEEGKISRDVWMNEISKLDDEAKLIEQSIRDSRIKVNEFGPSNAYMGGRAPIDWVRTKIKNGKMEIAYMDDLPYNKHYAGLGENNLPDDMKQIIEHEIGHLLQKGAMTNLDKELENLVLKDDDLFTDIQTELSAGDVGWSKFKASPEYFGRSKRYFQEGSKGQEKLPFLLELRQDLLDRGVIKDLYDEINPKMLKTHYNKYMKQELSEGKEIPLRIFDIMKNKKDNFDLLSKVLNKAPAIVLPIAGAAAISKSSAQDDNRRFKFQSGGEVQDYTVEYLTDQEIKDLESQGFKVVVED